MSVVYLIRMDRFYKIGRTQHLQARMKSFVASLPCVELLHVIEIDRPHEAENVADALEKTTQIAVKRSSLKAVLKKLAESGELEIVVKGKGRNPTQYRRK